MLTLLVGAKSRRVESRSDGGDSADRQRGQWRDEFSSGSHDEVALRLRRFSPLSPRLDGK
jgi:hypothetical protein